MMQPIPYEDFKKSLPPIAPKSKQARIPDFSEIANKQEFKSASREIKKDVANRFFEDNFASKNPNVDPSALNDAKTRFFKDHGIVDVKTPESTKKPGLFDGIGNEFHDASEHFKESASGRTYRAEKDKGSGVGSQVGGFLGPLGGTLGAGAVGAGVGSVIPGVGTAIGGLGGMITYGLGRGGTEDYQNQQDEIKAGKRKNINYGKVAGHSLLEGGINAVTGGEGGSLTSSLLKRIGINTAAGSAFGGGGEIIDQVADGQKIDASKITSRTVEGGLYGAVLGEAVHHGGKVVGSIAGKIKGKSNPSTPIQPLANNTATNIAQKIAPESAISEPKAPSKSNGSNFDTAFKHIVGSEGGFSNNKADHGGRTNHGVIQSTYNGYRQRKGLPMQDVTKITPEEVKSIYRGFYKESGADQLPLKESMAVFDMAINSGSGTAKRLWKKSGGDLNKFMELRRQFYRDIIASDPSQKTFEKGWNNRLDNLQKKIDSVDPIAPDAPDYSITPNYYVGKNIGGNKIREPFMPLAEQIANEYKVDHQVVKNMISADRKWKFDGEPETEIRRVTQNLRQKLDENGGDYPKAVSDLYSGDDKARRVKHILGYDKEVYAKRSKETESDPYIQSGKIDDLFAPGELEALMKEDHNHFDYNTAIKGLLREEPIHPSSESIMELPNSIEPSKSRFNITQEAPNRAKAQYKNQLSSLVDDIKADKVSSMDDLVGMYKSAEKAGALKDLATTLDHIESEHKVKFCKLLGA